MQLEELKKFHAAHVEPAAQDQSLSRENGRSFYDLADLGSNMPLPHVRFGIHVEPNEETVQELHG